MFTFITRSQHSGARGWDKRSGTLSSTKITSMGCLLCRTFNVQECATFMVSLVGAAASEFSSLIFPILMAFLMKVHTRQIHWRNVEFTATLLDQHIDPFTVLRSGIRMLQVGSTSFSMSLAADIPSGTRITLLAIRVQEKGVSLMCMMLYYMYSWLACQFGIFVHVWGRPNLI